MAESVLQAFRFALDPTPTQARRLASHAGAARFAYNFGLARVKADLDAREQDPGHERVAWNLAALRREWNARKDQAAPWWAENSKEAASSGLADLAVALKNWSDSKHGRRAGPRVGFPRFKRRGRCRESFRYTTGSFGVSGRCRVQLPRVGHVRTHEPTTKLRCKIERGEARVLSAAVCRDGARWYCSLCCEVERHDPTASARGSVIGVDAGVKHLAVLSTGRSVENPRALARAQRKLRRLQRRADRQRRKNNPGCYDEQGRALKGSRPVNRSNRQRQTGRRVTRLHTRARNVRRDALHKLTTELAVKHGTIVVERLNARGLCRAGNRGLRRAIHDAAMAEIGRQLAYKTAWRNTTLIQAPTLYPSSKTCSGCRAVKAKLPLGTRTYHCEHCGLVIDRDLNAARNLARLAETIVAGSGTETLNALAANPGKTRHSGRRVGREPGSPNGHQTGTASERSEAA
jgi:putative transposase